MTNPEKTREMLREVLGMFRTFSDGDSIDENRLREISEYAHHSADSSTIFLNYRHAHGCPARSVPAGQSYAGRCICVAESGTWTCGHGRTHPLPAPGYSMACGCGFTEGYFVPVEPQPYPTEGYGVVAQPDPVATDRKPVWDTVISYVDRIYRVSTSAELAGLVISDMRERDRIGRERYGIPLTSGNGRDHLVDAYQEALDLVVYLATYLDEYGFDPYDADIDRGASRGQWALFQVHKFFREQVSAVLRMRQAIEELRR